MKLKERKSRKPPHSTDNFAITWRENAAARKVRLRWICSGEEW
jgi:hypothetical protein